MAIETVTIDPARSRIEFSLRHLVLSQIAGRVTRFRGTIRVDTDDLTRSSVDLVIDAASLETGDPERDQHIRSAEFLNVERYPEVRFRSRRISRAEGRRYELEGDLTIRDVTREVTIEVRDRGPDATTSPQTRGSLTARARVDRRDFGLRWNQDLDTGGVVVGDRIEVGISLEVEWPPSARSPAAPEPRSTPVA